MMRKVLFPAMLGLMVGMCASNLAKADENQHWAIKNGGNWTGNDNVSVDYWFTEGGTMVGTAQLFIGPLVFGQADRPVVTSQFVNSNRNICLNADAFRAAAPSTKVTAVAFLYTRSFLPLHALHTTLPPTLAD